MATFICPTCQRELEFDRRRGHRLTNCKSCYTKLRRQRVKRMAVAYLGGKCEQCGYDRCLMALEFHHRDPTMKNFSLSDKGVQDYPWSRIQQELDKCALLCANCHREVEDGLIEI